MTRTVVFAKQPLPGRAKTRLAPAIGEKGAAELAADMLRRTVDEALATGFDVELRGDPDPRLWYRGRSVRLAPQGTGDLGARLSRAAEAAAPALLIGTDCPELDRSRLSAASAALEHKDAVIDELGDAAQAMQALDGSYTIDFPLVFVIDGVSTGGASDSGFTDAIAYTDCTRSAFIGQNPRNVLDSDS